MKKRLSNMHGVTLLEIMLVLAIAAMIIVMSVRYYQSATSSQQANTTLSQIQAITAAADSLAQASGNYATGLGSGAANLTPLLPGSGLNTPWGDTIVVTPGGASSYTVNLGNVPSGVCPLIKSKLANNNHFTGVSAITCSATAATAFTYTYVANP